MTTKDSKSADRGLQALTVPFHGDSLYLVAYNGEPHVPMKPVSEGMGLDWDSQRQKISAKFKTTKVEIAVVAADGKVRDMTCLPLRKLPGWLYSIQPGKVSPEIRHKVEEYQEECDEVLWQYWTKGEAKKFKVREAVKSYLPEFRRARTIKLETEAMALALLHMPKLSDVAKQTAMARAVNDAAGMELLPLPQVEEHLHTAKEVGDMLEISANMVGRLAKKHDLKTEQYGMYVWDKAAHSNKQVEAFRYNAEGIKALRHIVHGADVA